MTKKNILIIDDDLNFCKIIKFGLEKTGEFLVIIATDWKTGIETAKANHPDLILLDVLMPETDGGSVASSLHEDTTTKSIPIAYLTAVAKKGEVDTEKGVIGGNFLLSKSLTVEELIRCVKSILNLR